MAMRKKSGRQSGRQLMRESYSGRIFSLRQTFWQDNVLVQMLMYGKEAKNKNKRQIASTTLFRTKNRVTHNSKRQEAVKNLVSMDKKFF